MDAVVNILTQLGIDKSIFIQLIAALIVFVVFKYLLFEKLKTVLEVRDANTNLLEKEIEKKLHEIRTMTEKLRVELEEAHAAAASQMRVKKEKLKEVEDKEVGQAEQFAEMHIEKLSKEIQIEIQAFKDSLDKKKDELIDLLTKKVTRLH